MRSSRRSSGLLCLAVLCGTTCAADGCFLDIFGICGGASAIAKSLDALPDKVRDAAEKVLDNLFNNNLPPFVDKLTASAEQLLDRGEADYEKAVNATRDALTALAHTVVNECEELAKDVTKDVEEIVDTVMKDTVAAVDHIISDIDKSVNQLLGRLEMIGKEVFCAATGYIDTFEKQFSSYFEKQDCDCVQQMLADNPGLKQDCECKSCFHIGSIYPQCKCNPWGLKFAAGWYNRGKYQFAKCHLMKVIDWEHWTVQQIINQLSIVQEMSLSFRCLEDLQPGSTENRDYFTNEYTNISYRVLVLKDSDRFPVSAAARNPPSRISSPSKQSDPGCAGITIPECIVQTLAQLKTAEQNFKQAEADFTQAKKALEANLSAAEQRIGTLESRVGTVESDASSNKAGIASNKESIGSLSSRVGGLRVGLCDCKGVNLHSTAAPDGFVIVDFPYSCVGGCKAPYRSFGVDDDANPNVSMCRPCMEGDGSYARMAITRKHTSCTPVGCDSDQSGTQGRPIDI